jgi:hypothetical protein
MDVSASKGVMRAWVLLLDVTYWTNATCVSAANAARPKRTLLANGFWLLAPRTAH